MAIVHKSFELCIVYAQNSTNRTVRHTLQVLYCVRNTYLVPNTKKVTASFQSNK